MRKINHLLMLLSCTLLICLSSACDDDNKHLSDPASVIAGTYVGSGQLELVSLAGMPLETYPGMKIVVTKSSNEYVILTPYEADGSAFFSGGSGDVYQVTQAADGSFLLTSTSTPNSRVTISKSKTLTYYYPYVSVGGEGGYALSFTGTKQKSY